MNQPKTKIPQTASRSLDLYLKKVVNPNHRAHLVRLLKTIIECSRNETINVEDLSLEQAYQIIGKATLLRNLIEEFNTSLMNLVSNFYSIQPWSREMWLLRASMTEQIRIGHELARSIIYHSAKEKKDGRTEKKDNEYH
jgi:hypothetical protein